MYAKARTTRLFLLSSPLWWVEPSFPFQTLGSKMLYSLAPDGLSEFWLATYKSWFGQIRRLGETRRPLLHFNHPILPAPP